MKTQVATETQTATAQKVHVEDVDDVIGVAARLKDADADTLTVEELEEVAAELDIEPEYVSRAVEALRQRRAQAQKQLQQQKQRRKAIMAAIIALVVAILGGLGVTAAVGQGGLHQRANEVSQRRAQVVNVLERQQGVERRLKGQEMTPDREAEIIGAENRVRVEARRYDQAATEYNNYTRSLPGRVGAKVTDLPDKMPLSTEIQTW